MNCYRFKKEHYTRPNETSYKKYEKGTIVFPAGGYISKGMIEVTDRPNLSRKVTVPYKLLEKLETEPPIFIKCKSCKKECNMKLRTVIGCFLDDLMEHNFIFYEEEHTRGILIDNFHMILSNNKRKSKHNKAKPKGWE